MPPIVHVIGKILRLVGISSPEDSLRKPITASDPPSWRTPKPASPKWKTQEPGGWNDQAVCDPMFASRLNDAIVGAVSTASQARGMVGFEGGNKA